MPAKLGLDLSKSNIFFTASALKSSPSENFTPSFNLKTKVLPSSLYSKLSASFGTISPFS